MTDLNRRLGRIDNSRYTMIASPNVPRATFRTQHGYKTTFDLDYLIPFHVEEVLPGDTIQTDVTIFARLATLLFPLMDHITIETFFFFVPCRLVWNNWVRFMGEQDDPSDSIDYTIPSVSSPNGGYAVNSLYDYMGLPIAGPTMNDAETVDNNALPIRAYNLIWNQWFRDQNLQDSAVVDKDDGPDTYSDYVLKKRNKKHDYFTSCLPWPLKQNVEVSMGLGGTAPVYGIAKNGGGGITGTGNPGASYKEYGGITAGTEPIAGGWAAHQYTDGGDVAIRLGTTAADSGPYIYADLSDGGAATINALRLAFATQAFLERDARGGTRYTELLRTHFGVTPQDARLQRPEYIGGGRSDIQTTAIAQTSASDITGSSSPLGALGAAATAADRHSFSVSAAEHGYIIGIVNVSGGITYQQGKHRLWSRNTRYEFYDPAFAHLGEQAVLLQELYHTGVFASDTLVFGYQERWAEYRDAQSIITGKFRSEATGNIDEWHLSQQFGSAPTLNSTFIQQNTPFQRVAAAAELTAGQQVLFDSLFTSRKTRPLPMFSTPGLMDRF